MKPAINGLTSVVAYEKPVCSYQGTIHLRYTDRLTVMSSIRTWFNGDIEPGSDIVSNGKNEKRFVELLSYTSLAIRDELSYDPTTKQFNDVLSIQGYYPVDLLSTNEIYDRLYSLFEFLTVKCKQPYVVWHFYCNETKEYKEYKIVPR